ncbi:hypothetical protein N5J70_14555 [Pseudomonas sp. GD03909]|nr:hypothetical protein [Pseudomonas sp. GD03909]
MIGISLKEIYALEILKKEYIRERLERTITLLVSTAGFCIATLSSQEIPPIWNFGLTVIVLLYFIFLLLSAKHRSSPLKTELDKLYEQYKDHDETIKHLNTTNPWLGFEAEKVPVFMPALISALFVIYTLAEHACRAFKPLCS